MSGKLILLPKKSYTPWKAENIERVLRDERINEEKNQLEADEKRRKERIDRIRRMKKISRNPIQNVNINILKKTKKEPTLSSEALGYCDNMSTLLNNRYIAKSYQRTDLICQKHVFSTQKNKDKNEKPELTSDIDNKMTKYDVLEPYTNDNHSKIRSTAFKKSATFKRTNIISQRENFLTNPPTKLIHEKNYNDNNTRKKCREQQYLANVDRTTTIFF